MLYKLFKCITNTKSYKDYEARRIMLDTVMLTITNEYVKSLTKNSEDVNNMHKRAIEATDIRNKFCNRHIIYTKIFDYIFKKGLEES
jgi:hypothetical protein